MAGGPFDNDLSQITWSKHAMAEVERFEEKVKEALRAVMRHAVTGHAAPGYNNFCNDSAHALEILKEAGITPMNTAIVERYLDSGIS